MSKYNPTPEMWERYRQTGDATEIVELAWPIVKGAAAKVEQSNGYLGGLFREDLESIGAIGLMQAIRRYKPEAGSFIAMASLRVRGAIYDEMRRLSFAPRSAYGDDDRAQVFPVTSTGLNKGNKRDGESFRQTTLDFYSSIRDPATVDDRDELHARAYFLSPRQRQVMTMAYHDGMTFRGIAKAMGVSEWSVCNWHRDGLKAMRESVPC